MTAGTKSDFKIYSPQFFAGFTETLTQNAEVFNIASRGAIQVRTRLMQGEYAKESFFAAVSGGIVSRRDSTSVAAATDIAMTMGENISIKLDRGIGPVAYTLDSLVKAGLTDEQMSFFIGQQAGAEVWTEYLNTALAALYPALAQASALVVDATTSTLKTTGLVSGLSKFGDRANRIVVWLTHSKSGFNLLSDQIANYQMDTVAGYNLVTGNPVTLGRPMIMTDSSSLILTTPNPDQYITLGLVAGAITIDESEERRIVSDLVTGLKNLVTRVQGEYALNLGIKGFTWDLTNGGLNPAAATLATATNWDQTATSDKDLPGVIIKSL